MENKSETSDEDEESETVKPLPTVDQIMEYIYEYRRFTEEQADVSDDTLEVLNRFELFATSRRSNSMKNALWSMTIPAFSKGFKI